MRRICVSICLFSLFAVSAWSQNRTAFQVRIENVSPMNAFAASGVFNTPVGATNPGPVGPGAAYEFAFDAGPGMKVSFATMFIPSNDLFFAPDENGIALYDANGNPVSGDVTGQIMLWDAGTELNEEPGVGPNQAQRQSGANTGPADSNNTVRLVNDGFNYPQVPEVIQVTINSDAAPRFVVRIENVSTSTTLMPSDGSSQAVPIAPGVWVLHSEPAPLFAGNQADAGDGLEAIAEDGNPGMLGDHLAQNSGLNVVFSPGVWAVHTADAPFYTLGQADYGEGLEAIAEDGNADILAANLPNRQGIRSGAAFSQPIGASQPGPIARGGAYEFTVVAEPGEKLSFVSMFVPSNDLIVATSEQGIALFDGGGSPFTGIVNSGISLLDAGTEVNESPGIGPNQVQNQPAPNTGDADPDSTVREVDDGYTYPPVSDILRVTITPLETTPFYVRVVNVSNSSTLMPSDGSEQFVPLSPGVWAVHSVEAPLFKAGQADFAEGLEAIAEDGDVANLDAVLASKGGVLSNGFFNTAEGASGPGPLLPGSSYTFEIEATPGTRLSFASMFVPSNDLFYAPDEQGLALFDSLGSPISANYTGKIYLWDAGTEMNEEPGVGANQVQRQPSANTGPADPDNSVRMVDDGYDYPEVAAAVRVIVTPAPLQQIAVRIENISTAATLMPSDGSNQAVPLSPGLWAVHSQPSVFFARGAAERGRGLEHIAEDGDPGRLANEMALQQSAILSGIFNTPVGSNAPAPIGPGSRYEFTVWAMPGASLSFATMFVPSNDLFFAPDDGGIALFEQNGTVRTGDVTSEVLLWDAGSELNEEPGIGPNQVQRQAAPNTGPVDVDNTVRLVNDGFSYPSVAEVIRVTLSNVTTSAGNGASASVPDVFSLQQNYPNPFNPETSISYTLGRSGPVRLTIYNLLGQKVRQLVAANLASGSHSIIWDGKNDSGQDMTTGIYLYRLETAEFAQVRKMSLVR